jgi:hypothetical protein
MSQYNAPKTPGLRSPASPVTPAKSPAAGRVIAREPSSHPALVTPALPSVRDLTGKVQPK